MSSKKLTLFKIINIYCILSLIMLLSDRAISQENHTWEWLNPLPQGNPLFSVYFIDKNEGWVGGENGTVLHTTDGGKNWILVDFPFSRYVNGIYFSDVNNGWFWGSNNTIIKYTSGVTDVRRNGFKNRKRRIIDT